MRFCLLFSECSNARRTKIKSPVDVTDFERSVRMMLAVVASMRQRLTDLHHAGLRSIQNLDASTPRRT